MLCSACVLLWCLFAFAVLVSFCCECLLQLSLRAFAVLALAAAAPPALNFSCFFLLPLFLDNNNYTKSEIGIVMSTFGFSSILLTPYTSTLVDKYGKKLLSLVALLLMISSTLSFIFVVDFNIILFLRIIQGAAFSIFFNASSAIASNSLEDKINSTVFHCLALLQSSHTFLDHFFLRK